MSKTNKPTRKIADPTSKTLSDSKLKELKENANGILADARRVMINDLPFVGAVAMSLDLIPVRDPRIATAATDGKRVYFDIAFLAGLSKEELKFVIAHETYHVVLMHFMRQSGRNNNLWNQATDIEANNMLLADGLTMPEGGLCAKKYGYEIGLSAEDYYEILTKKSQNDQDDRQNNSNTSPNNNITNGSDNSRNNGDTSGNDDGQISGQFDKHIYQDSDTANGKSGTSMADKYGKIDKEDPDFQPKVEENTVEKVRQMVLSAAQQVERSRGELPGHVKSLVEKILKPQLPWREILSQWVTKTISNKTTWNRPNRRFAYSGTYLPSHTGDMVKIGVVVDTSGSCAHDGPKFLAEVNSIVKSFEYEMTLVQCDWQVQKAETYSEENPLDLENDKFEFVGNGGTQLTPGFDYFKDNDIDVDCIVCFTDGYIEDINEDFSDTPILWVVTGKNKCENIKCGEKVWLND